MYNKAFHNIEGIPFSFWGKIWIKTESFKNCR